MRPAPLPVFDFDGVLVDGMPEYWWSARRAALEECRLAVEQVVLTQARPVELLPRSESVRRMQAELVNHYRLRSAVFGRGQQQRLRVFPA